VDGVTVETVLGPRIGRPVSKLSQILWQCKVVRNSLFATLVVTFTIPWFVRIASNIA
jgi:hypothetical protein